MLIYFLKVNFLLVVFTATYWLLLRRGKLLQLNRAILLASILLAFALPVLPIAGFLESELSTPVRDLTGRVTVALSELAPAPTSVDVTASAGETGTAINPGQPAQPDQAFYWLGWVFVAVAAFLFFLLMRQLVHIFRLVLYSTNTREEGLTIVHTDEDVPPFSFFRFLVLNPTKYAGEELYQIIVHEKVHIRQYHYLDILVGEMLRVFCWYNPAAWMLNKLLKINLEFIADREVLSAGINRKSYQYQLLHMSSRGQSLRLTTPLNYSPIKMRISMMNAKKSGLLTQLRYALLLPVLLISVLAINPALAQDTQVLVGTASARVTTGSNVSQGTAKVANDQGTIATTRASAGRDIYFVITPKTKRKTLMDVQENLTEKGITVQYDNLNFNDGLLTAISVTIRSDDFSGNLSYDPLDGRLVFYDLQVSGNITGFEYGTPRQFSLKQRDTVDKISSGLLIRRADGRVQIRGSAEID